MTTPTSTTPQPHLPLTTLPLTSPTHPTPPAPLTTWSISVSTFGYILFCVCSTNELRINGFITESKQLSVQWSTSMNMSHLGSTVPVIPGGSITLLCPKLFWMTSFTWRGRALWCHVMPNDATWRCLLSVRQCSSHCFILILTKTLKPPHAFQKSSWSQELKMYSFVPRSKMNGKVGFHA